MLQLKCCKVVPPVCGVDSLLGVAVCGGVWGKGGLLFIKNISTLQHSNFTTTPSNQLVRRNRQIPYPFSCGIKHGVGYCGGEAYYRDFADAF